MAVYYFRPDEFKRGGRDWLDDMCPRLLVLLDVFRQRWGAAVKISPHPDALGREMDHETLSDHNYTRHRQVLAADVMPSFLNTRADAERALTIARTSGFTAIGLYPHWQPGPGLHLATRPDRRPESPALWGAIRVDGKQTYVSLEQALAAF